MKQELSVKDRSPLDDISKLTPCTTFPFHSRVDEIQTLQGEWRGKWNTPTSDVALILCFSIDSQLYADTTDSFKQVLVCWIEPATISMTPSQAGSKIVQRLKEQYTNWEPNARYYNECNPDKLLVQKICCSMRQSAGHNRVLFHYNGQGMPAVTEDGKIWLHGTNPVSVSIMELRQWLETPTIVVIDCNNAGRVIECYRQSYPNNHKEFIIFTSCASTEDVADGPPADLFTSCLTTPLQTAIYLWPGFATCYRKSVPGELSDRSSPIGQLNWILTTITDTIAWKYLPREVFQRYYRQDYLLSCLCRNFMIALRLSYPKHPQCWPQEMIPAQCLQSRLWDAWDLSLDLVVLSAKPSSFFDDQLTAFECSLHGGSLEQDGALPIILQTFLSPTYRRRTLTLLLRYMDKCANGVESVLQVGALHYILRLLKYPRVTDAQVRRLLLVVWAKILAVDKTCQRDLLNHKCYTNFMKLLYAEIEEVQNPVYCCCQPCINEECLVGWSERNLSLFCLARMVDSFEQAQSVVKDSLVPQLCDLLNDRTDWTCVRLAALTLERLQGYGRPLAILNNAVETISLTLRNSQAPALCREALVSALTALLGSDTITDQQVAACLLEMRNDINVNVRRQVAQGLQLFTRRFQRQFEELSTTQKNELRRRENSKWQPIGSSLHGSDKEGRPFESINLYTRVYQTLDELKNDPCGNLLETGDAICHPFRALVANVAGRCRVKDNQAPLSSLLLDGIKMSCCIEPEDFSHISSGYKFFISQDSHLSVHSYLPLIAFVDSSTVSLSGFDKSEKDLLETTHCLERPVGIVWMNEQYRYPTLMTGHSDGSLGFFLVNDDGLYNVDGCRTGCKMPILDWHGRSQQLLITSSINGSSALYDLEKQVCIQTWTDHVSQVQCTAKRLDSTFVVVYKDGFQYTYDVRHKKALASFSHTERSPVVHASIYRGSTCLTACVDGSLWMNDRLYDRPVNETVLNAGVQTRSWSLLLCTSNKPCADRLGNHNIRIYDIENKKMLNIEKQVPFENIGHFTQYYKLKSMNLHSLLPMVLMRYALVSEKKNRRKQDAEPQHVVWVLLDPVKIGLPKP